MKIDKKEKLIPELRFKEFKEEWQKSPLLDFRIKTIDGDRGNNYPHENDIQTSGYCLFLNAGNVTSKGFLFDNTMFISQEKDKILGKGQLERGDLVLTTRGTIGNISFYNNQVPYERIRINSGMVLIRNFNSEIDNCFLNHVFNTPITQRAIKRISFGSAQPQLTVRDINKIMLTLPTSIQEQQKISSFLSLIDKKIELLNKKKELLEIYKKGVMQKIFNREIRFKDSNGNYYPEWEEKKLGDYLVQYHEKTTLNNQFPVLTSSRKGIFFQKDYYDGNQIASINNIGYNIVPRNYFTYRHMSDDLVFKFNRNTICDKGIVSTLYPVFTTKAINDDFLSLKLNYGKEFKRYALMQKQGGSRTYMYFQKLQQLKVVLPNIQEQSQIAHFLSGLNLKINFSKYLSNKTMLFKKSLLQKMFV